MIIIIIIIITIKIQRIKQINLYYFKSTVRLNSSTRMSVSRKET